MKYNQWHVDRTDDGAEFTADFGTEDFDRWLDCDSALRVTRRMERELYQNCLYLAEAESRRIAQSPAELRAEIHDWAVAHNAAR